MGLRIILGVASLSAVWQLQQQQHNDVDSISEIKSISQQSKAEAMTSSSASFLGNSYENNDMANKSTKSLQVTTDAVQQQQRKPPHLVLFLHPHKAGGSSIIYYLRKAQIGNLPSISQNIVEELMSSYQQVEKEDDDGKICGANKDRICFSSFHPASVTDSIASKPQFWQSLYKAGVDYVPFEENFIRPDAYFAGLFDDSKKIAIRMREALMQSVSSEIRGIGIVLHMKESWTYTVVYHRVVEKRSNDSKEDGWKYKINASQPIHSFHR